MKWSVQQLQALKHKGLHVDESVDVSTLKEIDREIREVTPVHVVGDASFAKDIITFTLQISGSMTLPCARTLNDVEYPFSIQAMETFQLSEWATFDEDEEVHELVDNTVDLMPYVREQILLDKPLRVYSDKTEGPAPEEGPGWTLTTEEAQKEKVDPRLQKLQEFFKNNE
ncbi:DUF177 domain-containing protein [Paenalkalicoccus suaedae]|uniref:DUF177 domain-containing protein n=1 Tax=Paenalkalicoccus suaedae TaxID=2592382 RepID=A0A859FFE6_9BACI|nr:YceD family protein [Paenalkalicoccus suaedae]QKS71538.1 DUF177 domain-containing protein [Paenalkalicoccus suaedae]